MQTMIVYDSEYGNTGHVAEAIAAEFQTTGTVEMINVRTAPMTIPATVDLLVVGGPTQMHHVSPPLRAQLDALPAHALRNVKLATFDTRARGPRLFTGAASGGIAKALTRCGEARDRARELHCRGQGGTSCGG
jgi:flavodoxin